MSTLIWVNVTPTFLIALFTPITPASEKSAFIFLSSFSFRLFNVVMWVAKARGVLNFCENYYVEFWQGNNP